MYQFIIYVFSKEMPLKRKYLETKQRYFLYFRSILKTIRIVDTSYVRTVQQRYRETAVYSDSVRTLYL